MPETREQNLKTLKKNGITVPSTATDTQIETVMDMVIDGKAQEDIDKMFEPKASAPPPPPKPAPPPEPAVLTMTQAQVDAMVQSSVDRAVAATEQRLAGSITKDRIQINLEKPEERPVWTSQSDVPPEFFTENTMRVMAPGNEYILSSFLVKGQWIKIPRQKVIKFKKFTGRGTQKFGRSQNVVMMSYYDTNDVREQRLFAEDDRMLSGELWVPNDKRSFTEDEQIAHFAIQENRNLESFGFEALRGIARLELPAGKMDGSAPELRVAIAANRARIHVKAMQVSEFGKEVEKEMLLKK
jgi:hypothetical protein